MLGSLSIKRAVDAVFDHLGVKAIYRPSQGDPIENIKVIVRQADVDVGAFGVGVLAEATVVDVRASEVPEPAVGGSFDVDGEIYTINSQPRRDDSLRLVWTCPAPESA